MMRYPNRVMATLVLLIVLVTGRNVLLATTATSPSTVDLLKAVHFLTPSGDDVVVGPGTFELEAVKEGLRLTPKGGKTDEAKIVQAEVLPAAEANAPDAEKLNQPTDGQMAHADEIGDDTLLVTFVVPEGRMQVLGSYSGIRSREVCGSTNYSLIPLWQGRISCPSEGQLVSGKVFIRFDINPNPPKLDNPLNPVPPIPGSGVVGIDIWPDEVLFQYWTGTGSGPNRVCTEHKYPYTCHWDTIPVANGTYKIRVLAFWGTLSHRADVQSVNVTVANYSKTIRAADGALWGLAMNPRGAVYRNHIRMPGTASDLRVVRGQVQALSVRLGAPEWYAWNGTTWVQPVIQPVPVPTQPPTAPPTAVSPPVTPAEVIVDNRSPSVQRIGSWCLSGTTVGFYATDSEKTCDDQPLKKFRWTPTIPIAGLYEVYVWWVNNASRSAAVPYIVHHAAGDTTKVFDQRTGGNQWVRHGRYSLAAGSSNYVEVSNGNGGIAGADAVRFVRVELRDHRTGQ